MKPDRRSNPPASLSEESQKLFTAMAERRCLWGRTDALALLENCLLQKDRAEALKAILDAEGMLKDDRFGQAKAHPLLLPERQARAMFAKLERDLPFFQVWDRPAPSTEVEG